MSYFHVDASGKVFETSERDDSVIDPDWQNVSDACFVGTNFGSDSEAYFIWEAWLKHRTQERLLETVKGDR